MSLLDAADPAPSEVPGLPGSASGSSTAAGTTEVVGPAEDLQAELFGGESHRRPATEGYGSAQDVADAAETARQGMTVRGGLTAGQAPVVVDTEELLVTSQALGQVSSDLGGWAAGLVPLTAELELWALTGEVLLGEAASLAGRVAADALTDVAGLAVTAARLEWSAQRYEVTERAVTGAFSADQLDTPVHGVGAGLLRDLARTGEKLEAALVRADVDSPAAFRDSVRFSALGVVVRGGGPRGTDAVIRGPGADDLLENMLRWPLPLSSAARGGRAPDAGASSPTGGAGRGGDGPAGDGGTPWGTGPTTLGQYLRHWTVDWLSEAGRREEPGAGAEARQGEGERTALAAAVAATMMRQPLSAGVYAAYRTGRRLPPAERPVRALEERVRRFESRHALRPARRELITGVTPHTARAHHMTPLSRRPLPPGLRFDGEVPVTVAGTAAAVKDAKNIVSGVNANGEPVENSTVLVQKATGVDGRTAYSVVLTGTEKWTDSSGVHDLKGIGLGMTTPPSAALTELPQAQRMAVQALQDAGIRPGDTVVLAGHSLGGIDAAGLASNQEFRERYDVAALTTFGAPVGDFAIPSETSVMAVEHVDDVVPTLDGVPNPDGERRSTVQVDTPYADAATLRGGATGTAAHEMNLYTVGARGISDSGHPAVESHERRLGAAIPHGRGARTESYVCAGWEEHSGPPALVVRTPD